MRSPQPSFDAANRNQVNPRTNTVRRRHFLGSGIAATAYLQTACSCLNAGLAAVHAAEQSGFKLNYMLASCMYGYVYVGEILAEVNQVGATAIDLWPKVHGNQREQLDDLGIERFRQMLQRHQVTVGCLTQYPLGPFRLAGEISVAKQLGANTIVTGGEGPKGLSGSELKSAVAQFCEKMKPHLERAQEANVTIAIENHANNLIESVDSLQWLHEFAPSDNLGIALAPYHLPQDSRLLSDLIRTLGNRLQVFYAWQHGKGCMKRQAKEDELLQMPGRGSLDFAPLVEALADIEYTGWTEIFMHPFPRGIPILNSVAEVTQEINAAREYLRRCGAQ